MTRPVIRTPRGVVWVGPSGRAELKWSATFKPKWQGKFNRAQFIVDSEILRLCEPYTPMQTGMLIKSGTLGTEPGTGEVAWIAPYARAQYFLSNRRRPSETGPLRGSYWFERMKEANKDSIITRARGEVKK